MKKRGLKTFIIAAIILCTIWVGYKAFLLHYYKSDEHSYIKEQLENAQNISITSDKSLANTKFLDMNLFISHEYKEYNPQGFKEDNGQGYYQKIYSSNNETFDIWLQKMPFTLDDVLSDFKFDAKKLMKKYNIKDEIDLLRYYKEQKSTKRNIFWSTSALQMEDLITNYIVTSFSAGQNSKDYSFLTGDLNGIMTKEISYIQVNILNGNERYLLLFNKNTITDEQVKNILKSVYFS